MTEIYLHSRKIDSIFQLLGEHENDISYSVAWALSQCPSYLHEFIKQIFGIKVNSTDIEIRLQHHEKARGITDIEIELANEFYIIVEAKRGWNLPDKKQLKKYAKRPTFLESKAAPKRIVVLSECSQEYATFNLPTHKIGKIKIIPLSWKNMATYAKNAQGKGSHAEKRLLRELLTYLGGLMTMQNVDSNLVYVVSLSSGIRKKWNISWIDIVKKRLLYFHPFGVSGWPKIPPNYIAFRYSGKLQSIHHIKDYEITTDLHKKIPEIPSNVYEFPLILYKLGPAFGPAKEVKTGKIYPNGRVWCMLDTLFTCKTISEARDVSKKRQEKIN
ncbi:MAG TPA: hypothetical protein PLX02_02710 [Syntrophorhabdaceae bacterium]|nr:hypothetical protein [Syntrophorhabdaceae bacterium]